MFSKKYFSFLSVEQHFKNVKNIKYFIASNKNRIHNLSRLQTHTCATAPRLTSYYNLGDTISVYLQVRTSLSLVVA